MSLMPIFEDECSNCGKKRTVYNNYSAYCNHCKNQFDVAIKYQQSN